MTTRYTKVNTQHSTYDVVIGESVLSEISRIDDLLLRERFAVIVSARVNELYEEYIRDVFKRYNNYDVFLMKDGEENKNYLYAGEFLNEFLKKGYTRKSAVIGIGGGVVGDFAGFLAALYMRGIPVIHVPTTLLAMVDSSIGGKVAVNITAGKNIVGAFYQPGLVISDINFTRTLPENELKNGLTEVLKHGVIGENTLLEIMDENNLDTIKRLDNILDIVHLSAEFKSAVVEQDEKEGGLRAILNFGHTAGHAIESLMEYRGISHGEAVAIGMKIEMEISRRMGWLSNAETGKINEIINRYGLIHNNYELNAEDILKHMKYDKKNTGNKIKFALLNGLGNPVFDQSVNEDLLKEIIQNI